MKPLTYYERQKIEFYQGFGYTHRAIALLIKRHHSIVSRELKRNTPQFATYQSAQAHALAQARAGNTNQRKLVKNLDLQIFVVSQLKQDRSPAQIAGILKHYPP